MNTDDSIDKIYAEEFRSDLASLLNCHGIDAALGVPDFVVTSAIQGHLSVAVGTMGATQAWRDASD